MDSASVIILIFFAIVVVFFRLTSYRARQTIAERDAIIADTGAQLAQCQMRYKAMRALNPGTRDVDIDAWISAWIATHPLGQAEDQ